MGADYDPSAVLPLLKPPDWEGAASTACRRLANAGEAGLTVVPWVAFGYDRPSTFEFLQAVDGSRLRAVEADALDNLRRRRSRWLAHETGEEVRFRFLVCVDDFFSSERILDKGFLLHAHELLGANELVLAVPRRSVLMAISKGQPTDALFEYAAIAASQYHRAESPPVSPDLFIAEAGELRGMVSGVKGVGEAVAKAENRERAPRIEGHHARQPDGTTVAVVCAAGTDLAFFQRDLSAYLLALLRQLPQEPDFGGRIDVQVVREASSPEVLSSLPRLEAHFRNLPAVHTRSGARITLAAREVSVRTRADS